MEVEREELTKKYWPQLSSMCGKAGYEFVPVDLRWGITSEMSSSASTIEVCLREMDRSDMIVGFFGQVNWIVFNLNFSGEILHKAGYRVPFYYLLGLHVQR